MPWLSLGESAVWGFEGTRLFTALRCRREELESSEEVCHECGRPRLPREASETSESSEASTSFTGGQVRLSCVRGGLSPWLQLAIQASKVEQDGRLRDQLHDARSFRGRTVEHTDKACEWTRSVRKGVS